MWNKEFAVENSVDSSNGHYFESYERSIESDLWKENVPGKQILSTFASRARLDEDRLKTLYIRKAMECDEGENPFGEIENILEEFSR